jgi:hypothetical protein
LKKRLGARKPYNPAIFSTLSGSLATLNVILEVAFYDLFKFICGKLDGYQTGHNLYLRGTAIYPISMITR